MHFLRLKTTWFALATMVMLTLTALAAAQTPDWQTLPLTDARTGDPFTLGDFAGKTVYVEPMATWCSNCRQQLGRVQEVQASLADKVIFLALSVETTLSAADLAAYADEQGFAFSFAVMTPEFLRALAADLGQSALTPPATPHFIVYPDGSRSDLMTGPSTPDAISAAVQP